jgi:hypothetical protein
LRQKKEILKLKEYKSRGASVTFVVEVESLTTDAVSGTWTGNAYGAIVFSKASASNPMWTFEPSSIAVQFNGDGIVATDKTYQLVQDSTTGFIGVRTGDSNAIKAGSVIVVSGVFVNNPSDTIYPNGIGVSYSTRLTDISQNQSGNKVV